MREALNGEAFALETDPDDVIRIQGSGVTLDAVWAAFNEGANAEEIIRQYPSISLADAHQAVGYCLRHPAAVDAYLAKRGSIQRSRPVWLRARRTARSLGRFLKSSVVLGFILGMVGAVATERVKIYFSDRDLASVVVVARNPFVARLGVVQVLRADSTIAEQQRFQDAPNSTIVARLGAGRYEIRIRLLTSVFVVARRQFDRGSRSELSDVGLAVPELFADEEFVHVPAGRFMRGDRKFAVASPPHELFLSEFRIRSTPVTSCEYSTYVASQRYASSDDIDVCSGKDADKPAVYVTWEEAKRFCAWVSDLKGRPYKLPTEAQYERAMRISGSHQYPWGDMEFDPEKPRIPLANYSEYWRGRTTPERTPVRAFPSARGLYDIAGNVWEWTSDWYDPEFYNRDESRIPDCRGPRDSALNQVSIRGGSFSDPLQKLSCAFRGGVDPAIGYANVGFRLVK